MKTWRMRSCHISLFKENWQQLAYSLPSRRRRHHHSEQRSQSALFPHHLNPARALPTPTSISRSHFTSMTRTHCSITLQFQYTLQFQHDLRWSFSYRHYQKTHIYFSFPFELHTQPILPHAIILLKPEVKRVSKILPEKALFFKGSQASPASPSDKSSINIKMATQHWWNDNDGGKPHVLGENPVPVLLCPPKIPHALDVDRTWRKNDDRTRNTKMHHRVGKLWNVWMQRTAVQALLLFGGCPNILTKHDRVRSPLLQREFSTFGCNSRNNLVSHITNFGARIAQSV